MRFFCSVLAERPIPFDHMMYDHLQKWGPRREEVKFFLRHEESPAESNEQSKYIYALVLWLKQILKDSWSEFGFQFVEWTSVAICNTTSLYQSHFEPSSGAPCCSSAPILSFRVIFTDLLSKSKICLYSA